MPWVIFRQKEKKKEKENVDEEFVLTVYCS